MDCGRRQGRNGGSGGSARCQDDALGYWWETVPPLGLLFRLALGGDGGAERFHGVQLGRHVGQDSRETHVVLWSRLGRLGEVDVCPMTELDARAIVRAKGEWIRDDSWRLDCDGLEEGQDVAGIVCDGGQRLGDILICLTWLLRLLVLCLYADFSVFIVVVVFPAGVSLFLCPLCDGASKNIQDLARIRLPVEDCGLREKFQEEDGILRRPLRLLLQAREVAGGGAREDFRDQGTDIVAVHGKIYVNLEENNRR